MILLTYYAGTPNKPLNITRIHTIYNITASSVTLSWNTPTDGRIDMYHMNISYDTNQQQLFTNTPIGVVEGIPYDEQVLISVASVNCYSESERVYFYLTISENPSYC